MASVGWDEFEGPRARESVHTGPARALGVESLAVLLSPKRTRAEMSPPHRWSDRALLPPFSACCVRRCMCVHTHTQVRTQVYTYMPAPITHTHTPCTYNTHAHTHTRTCTPPQTLPSQVHGWPSTARFLVDEETAWPLPTTCRWLLHHCALT